MNKKIYRFSVITEDEIGIINQILIIFTRRRVYINSLSCSNIHSEGENFSKLNFSIFVDSIMAHKCRDQILKIIEVKNVYYFSEEFDGLRELAIFKIYKSDISPEINLFILENKLKKIYETDADITYEISNTPSEINKLFLMAKEIGIKNFSSSGTIFI